MIDEKAFTDGSKCWEQVGRAHSEVEIVPRYQQGASRPIPAPRRFSCPGRAPSFPGEGRRRGAGRGADRPAALRMAGRRRQSERIRRKLSSRGRQILLAPRNLHITASTDTVWYCAGERTALAQQGDRCEQ